MLDNKNKKILKIFVVNHGRDLESSFGYKIYPVKIDVYELNVDLRGVDL